MRCVGKRTAYGPTNKVLYTNLEKVHFIKYFNVKYKEFGEFDNPEYALFMLKTINILCE